MPKNQTDQDMPPSKNHTTKKQGTAIYGSAPLEEREIMDLTALSVYSFCVP